MQKNSLFGQVGWKKEPASVYHSEGSFDDGVVAILSERTPMAIEEPATFYNPTLEICCAVHGYILNREELRSSHQVQATEQGGIIIELYARFGPAFLSLLDGIFLIILYDKKASRLFIFTDSFGFVLPVYYYSRGESLVFSTSLKKLLLSYPEPPEMNMDALRDLLFTQKCIPNELTLIRGISKLPAGFRMVIDLKEQEICMEKCSWKVKRVSKQHAKQNLLKQLQVNTVELLPFSGPRRAITLSSGFDTNILLHFLTKASGESVSTYTIGGQQKDEIPLVKKITPHYPAVTGHSAYVPAGKLRQLPRIVWNLEGYLYEEGIYLMDELGQLLRAHKEQLVITGEGGDGLFGSYKNMQVQKWRMRLIGTLPGYLYYRFIRPLFHLQASEIQVIKKLRRLYAPSLFSKGRDLNMKKMGILLNAHGIMTLNPFLSMEYRAACRALGKKLSRNKKFYKEEVRKTVQPGIADILSKIGGSTDTWYLLEPYLHLLDALLSSAICQELLSDRDRARIRRDPRQFTRLIHQLFFIYTFQRLFLEGKYDFTREEDPGVALEDLF